MQGGLRYQRYWLLYFLLKLNVYVKFGLHVFEANICKTSDKNLRYKQVISQALPHKDKDIYAYSKTIISFFTQVLSIDEAYPTIT